MNGLGWSQTVLKSDDFGFLSYLGPVRGDRETITIYLEGDGLAFTSSGRVSSDPTPSDPIALRLAIAQPQGTAAYLARPCQYAQLAGTRNCHYKYWSTHRYSKDVIRAMSQAVDAIKRAYAARQVVLVGYSGGGTIAQLIANRRADITAVITVSGLLDIKTWADQENLPPLTGSLNPAAEASHSSGQVQIHLIGGEDKVVPPYVTRAYQNRLNSGHRAKFVQYDRFDHSCCWVKSWPKIWDSIQGNTLRR